MLFFRILHYNCLLHAIACLCHCLDCLLHAITCVCYCLDCLLHAIACLRYFLDYYIITVSYMPLPVYTFDVLTVQRRPYGTP